MLYVFNNHYDCTKWQANCEWTELAAFPLKWVMPVTPLAAQIHGQKHDIEEPWSPTRRRSEHANTRDPTPLHSSVIGSHVTVSPDPSSLVKWRQRQTSVHYQSVDTCAARGNLGPTRISRKTNEFMACWVSNGIFGNIKITRPGNIQALTVVYDTKLAFWSHACGQNVCVHTHIQTCTKA